MSVNLVRAKGIQIEVAIKYGQVNMKGAVASKSKYYYLANYHCHFIARSSSMPLHLDCPTVIKLSKHIMKPTCYVLS